MRPFIDIAIDLRAVLDLADSMSRATVMELSNQVLTGAITEIHRNIHVQANRNLRKTRQIYKRNISLPDIQRYKASITLTGALPNMLEQGASAFDMKEGFRRSRKATLKANGGWYLTIPFRYATAGSIADSEVFAGVMPKDISDFAQKMKASITVPFLGTVRRGDRIKASDLGAKYGVLKTRAQISGSRLSFEQAEQYTHKSPIFQGLQRSKKFYQRASQSQYNTFRRVSDNSEVNSWIHRGLVRRNLFGKAVENTDLDKTIAVIVDEFFEAKGVWQ